MAHACRQGTTLWLDGLRQVWLSGGESTVAVAGSQAIDLRSGAGAQTLLLSDGSDRAWSGGGDDRLVGRHGHDKLYGEEGHDLLLGGRGDDLLDGGDGDDVAVFVGSLNDYSLGRRQSGATVEFLLRQGTTGDVDLLRQIEWLDIAGRRIALPAESGLPADGGGEWVELVTLVGLAAP